MLMEALTKEITRTVRKMASELTSFQMVPCTLDSTRMIISMVRAKSHSLMAKVTLENGN